MCEAREAGRLCRVLTIVDLPLVLPRPVLLLARAHSPSCEPSYGMSQPIRHRPFHSKFHHLSSDATSPATRY